MFGCKFVKQGKLKMHDAAIPVEFKAWHVRKYGYVGVGEMYEISFRPSDDRTENGSVATARLILTASRASACAHTKNKQRFLNFRP